MKKLSLIIAAATFVFAMSCKNSDKKDGQSMKDDVQKAMSMDSSDTDQEDPITLSEIKDFKEYPDVSLEMTEPKGSKLKEGDINFKFSLTNMKIGEQTEGAEDLGLANVDGGQHIHFIIDNDPYIAEYKKSFSHELDEGAHTIVAFPARSYHMAVKDDNAYVAKKVTVGDPDKDQFKDVDFSKPTLVYSRPKGEYKGEDNTKKVLLDFYLLNTDLSSNGNKVKATINDEEFTLDKWAPYAIEGLPMGENTVKLELIDENGETVDGPFNKVERTFTLKE